MLDAQGLAAALEVPLRTAQRWLACWAALGVAGVAVERSPGRRGWRYVAAADLPDRWRRGELPAPRMPDPDA